MNILCARNAACHRYARHRHGGSVWLESERSLHRQTKTGARFGFFYIQKNHEYLKASAYQIRSQVIM